MTSKTTKPMTIDRVRTIGQFNEVMQAEGMQMELVKGRGYLYFITIAPLRYDSESVMVYAWNQMTPAEWMEWARDTWTRLNTEDNRDNKPAESIIRLRKTPRD